MTDPQPQRASSAPKSQASASLRPPSNKAPRENQRVSLFAGARWPVDRPPSPEVLVIGNLGLRDRPLLVGGQMVTEDGSEAADLKLHLFLDPFRSTSSKHKEKETGNAED